MEEKLYWTIDGNYQIVCRVDKGTFKEEWLREIGNYYDSFEKAQIKLNGGK